MAYAFEMGIDLGAVELIQLGDSYFVVDGHHRISVAKTRGQIEIDAQVHVWSGTTRPVAVSQLMDGVGRQQPFGAPASILNGVHLALNAFNMRLRAVLQLRPQPQS